MIALKKLYGDELLRLALILSLLKADPNEYLEQETQALIAGLSQSNGTDWSIQPETRILTRHMQIHPKSIDHTLIEYERQLFEELNSLGRYNSENTNRILSQPYLHTYLVNNVATETATPALQNDHVNQAESNEIDGVSADDNVAHEVKIDDNSQDDVTNEVSIEGTEAVVTLSADFLNNRTGSDIFADIVSRTYDVNDFLIPSKNMFVKEAADDASTSDLDVVIKKEADPDLYSDDNAIDFVPYFETRSKFEIEDPEDVFHQNIADLKDYGEIFETNKDLRADLDSIDLKQDPENLEKYLLENTPLESEELQLASIFDEGMVLEMKRERASTSFTSASSSSGVSEMDGYDSKVDIKTEDEGHHTGDELTQEDMDLIEVLWKQDVDMGFCLNTPDVAEDVAGVTATPHAEKHKKPTDEEIRAEDVEKVKASLLDTAKEDDPWAGISYTIDTETGEYVVQGELPGSLVGEEGSRFDLLEEALQLVELSDDVKDEQPLEGATGGGEGSTMLHPAMARHALPHHMAHYHNQSLMRSMSVEQRWQDLASLLTVPPPPEQYHQHYQHHVHNMSAHGAAGYAPSYAPVAPHMPEKHHEHYGAPAPLDGAYKVESAHHPQQHDALYYQNPPPEIGPTNQDGFLQSILNDEDLQLMDMAMNEGMYTMRILDGGGSAGAPIPATAPPTHNHTHLMMTERDSGSDSAVSSMGSERVPSLSDGEWDSHNEYHSSKFRPYDSSYGRDRVNPNGAASQPPPQKKHHMFGKRCFQEQPTPQLEAIPALPPHPAHSGHTTHPARELSVIKYECGEPPACQHDNLHLHNLELASRPTPLPPHMGVLHPSLDLNSTHPHSLLQSGMSSPAPNPGRFTFGASARIRHNHTYCAPEHAPPSRDKRVRRLTDGSMSDGGSTASGHLTRDEKRAKALGIPIEVYDIINLPMDEFNERLSKHDLSEAQLSLIRDIRRRGKNKVAAQNCRKRKLDQITSLADEVRLVRDRKIRTQRDHASLTADRQRVKERFAALYRHVFQNLRDPEGRPLSSSQYSLQQAADGNVVLVPRMHHNNDQSMNRTSDEEIDRKTKSFDQ